jgi:magnesium chelatase subunit I
MRENLIRVLEQGHEVFPGIVGYEDSVVPQVVNAILARHNFILLGLRGQAKSRILRALVSLLDPELPVIAGSEVNDNPFKPLSKYGRQLVDQQGDDAPIEWVQRESRFVEKLATPDVTVADIIGDVDPRSTLGYCPGAIEGFSQSTNCPIWQGRSRWRCSTSCRKVMCRLKATLSVCCWMS